MNSVGESVMSQSCFEANKARRRKRQQWVAERLKEADINTYDIAEHIGISPRTWREWVAQGIFPIDKEGLILEALSITKGAVDSLFVWRFPPGASEAY